MRKHHSIFAHATGHTLTAFFPKMTSAAHDARTALSDLTNAASHSPSPACTPDASPTVYRALFDGTGTQDSQTSCTTTIAPACTAAPAATAAATVSCWDATPPDAPASVIAPPVPASRGSLPAPPTKAPRKAPAPPRRTALAPAPSPPLRPELICVDSLDSEDCKPFTLNHSQPSQSSQHSQPNHSALDASTAASMLGRGSGGGGDTHMFGVSAVSSNPPSGRQTRSNSACSDIVIQASQEADTDDDERHAGTVTARLFDTNSAAASQASTPLSTPQQPPQGALDFAVFNETLAAANATHRPASAAPAVAASSASPHLPHFSLSQREPPLVQQHAFADMPPPTSSPVFTSGKQGGGLFRNLSRSSGSYAQVAQRSLSTVGGAALPPPIPRHAAAPTASQGPSSTPSTFHQTNLNFMRSNSISPLQLTQIQRSNSIDASQMSQQSAAGGEAHGHSLDGMFCTPQDQPVRERTLGEMSEELHLQREGVQLNNYLAHQGVAHNTHMPLAITGRTGSSNVGAGESNSGIVAPPIKKARLARQAAARGLESMHVLGSTLPPAEGDVQQTQPLSQPLSQQLTQCAPPAAAAASSAHPANRSTAAPITLDNPFITALAPVVTAKPAAATAAAAGARGGKKRGLESSSSAAAAAAASSAATPSVLGSLPSNSNSFLMQNFTYIRQFGIGSFGLVMLCRHRLDGCLYAIKKSKNRIKGANSSKLLMREAQVLAFMATRMDRPASILHYFNSWIEEGHVYVQTEYCEGGSLAAILKRGAGASGESSAKNKKSMQDSNFPGSMQQVPFSTTAPRRSYAATSSSAAASLDSPDDAYPSHPFPLPALLQIGLQIGQALAFMHANGLVHLDVKPENLLSLSSGNADGAAPLHHYRLGDFGLACRSSEGDSPLLSVGDKRYLPGEALDESIASLPALDCFALGVTLYELATGVPFALPMSQLETLRIRNADIQEIADHVGPALYEVIRELLHPDPQARKSMKDTVRDIQNIISDME